MSKSPKVKVILSSFRFRVFRELGPALTFAWKLGPFLAATSRRKCWGWKFPGFLPKICPECLPRKGRYMIPFPKQKGFKPPKLRYLVVLLPLPASARSELDSSIKEAEAKIQEQFQWARPGPTETLKRDKRPGFCAKLGV